MWLDRSAAQWLLALCLWHVLLKQSLASVPFQGRSFSLWASVSQVELDENLTLKKGRLIGHVQESYSSEQSRAKISYRLQFTKEKSNVGRLYHDADNKQTLLVEIEFKSTCKQIKPKDLALLPNLDVSSLELDNSSQSNHVVGLARLMLFVQHHKDKLRMVGEPLMRRNMMVVEYRYTFDDVELAIYYSAAAIVEDAEAPPMQIIVYNLKQIIQVDFSHIKLTQDDSRDKTNGQVYVDQFAFPRVCIAAMAGQVLHWRQYSRFSFEATITYDSSSTEHVEKLPMMNVAYDQDLSILSSSYSNRRIGTDRVNTRKVATFKTGRIYQVMEYGQSEKMKQECLIFKLSFSGIIGSKEPTVSAALTGSDLFVQLGQAWVRGQKTRLYAAVKNTLPRWLEQPVEYKYKGALRAREPATGIYSSNETPVTLIYVTENDVVLQMEVFKDRNIVRVEMFNFIWELDRPASELFSLHLACSKTGLTKHAKFELLLGRMDGEKFEDTPPRIQLDFRLLSIMQESLFMPATMIYDMESRLVKKMDLFSSFRVASHSDNVVELTYLGKGDQKAGFSDDTKKLLTTTAQSFQLCLELTAKLPLKKAYFGYSLKSKRCLIGSSVEAFVLFNREDQPETNYNWPEIYQIEHNQNGWMVSGRWLNTTSRESFRQSLLGKDVIMKSFQSDGSYLAFQMKKLRIEMAEEQQSGLMNVENEIYGFGLPNEKPNIQFVPNKRSWNLKNSTTQLGVTLVECRIACSLSDTCQSYSVCQRLGGLECILSPLDFLSNNEVIKQLDESRNQSTWGKLDINLEDGNKLKLIKHPNCDLYTKIYMDHFELDQSGSQSAPTMENLVGVKGKEECAKRCAKLNLEVLAQEASLAGKLDVLVNSKVTDGQLEELNRLMEARRENSERLCVSFSYLERLQVVDEKKFLSDLRMDEKDFRAMDGFCSLEIHQTTVGHMLHSLAFQTSTKASHPKFTRYRFKLMSFYNQQVGVRLLGSKLSRDDAALYSRARRHGGELSEEEHTKLRLLVESGTNFQEMLEFDEDECAKACFFISTEKTVGPWPMCSSFDLVYDEKSARKMCLLNSMSLEQAMNFQLEDLIGDISDEKPWVHWTHFEPGFLPASSSEEVMEARLELDESFLSSEESQTFLTGFALFIIGWFAILCGTFIGVHIGQRYISIQEADRQAYRDRVSIAELNLTAQMFESLNHE